MSWLCKWCEIYGKYPTSEAYRPDVEEGVITEEGDKICKVCANKWYEGKHRAKQENEKKRKESQDG